MARIKEIWKNWYFFIIVLIVVMISEKINIITIPVGIGSIMFLPLLYAMVIMLGLYLIKPFKLVGKAQEGISGALVVTGISVFIAKVSVVSGVALQQVIEAGPALLLQELGNLGTIFVALPVALLLGFKREAVGMTHSIAREPNVGIIATKYGLDSPEGEGVITIYVVGTLIGTIFMGLLASLLASGTGLHPLSLAMATGVGSGSMMAAASAPLVEMFPKMADEITAFAATSNVLSTADTTIVTIFIGLPLCNWLYKKLEPKIGREPVLKKKKTVSAKSFESDEGTLPDAKDQTKGAQILEMIIIVLITACIAYIGNYIYSDGAITFSAGFWGMVILVGIAIAGDILGILIPKVPSIIWITIIGILLGMSYSPTAAVIVPYVDKIQMLPMATPILAYAGVTMGKNWEDFKNIGWRGIVVACCTMFGTFIGSALIAQLVLSLTGVI
ncbi:MAG: DUF3100 domain-containing protein [Anaerovoracaceae bacterium]|jgi:hypothetical protein